MSDLRKDPILEHWVIVAANRSQRPGAFIESAPFEAGLPCPFCEGHEDILHTTPFDTTAPPHYHWRIEVVPILARTAGFELGTGWYINLVAPEEAACRMREAK